LFLVWAQMGISCILKAIFDWKGHPVYNIGASKGHNSRNKRFFYALLASKTFSITFSNVLNSPSFKLRICKL
jgi:hypothetical protein